MIYGLNATLSALRAYEKKMNVTADNIANVNTDGFEESRALFQEEIEGAVSADVEKVDTPGPPNPEARDYPDAEEELSNVDLAEEITEMIPITIGYKANLESIEAWDEMLGSLLDIFS